VTTTVSPHPSPGPSRSPRLLRRPRRSAVKRSSKQRRHARSPPRQGVHSKQLEQYQNGSQPSQATTMVGPSTATPEGPSMEHVSAENTRPCPRQASACSGRSRDESANGDVGRRTFFIFPSPMCSGTLQTLFIITGPDVNRLKRRRAPGLKPAGHGPGGLAGSRCASCRGTEGDAGGRTPSHTRCRSRRFRR